MRLRSDIRKSFGNNAGNSQSFLVPWEGLRSIPHGNYVILFRYRDALVEIVSIIEGHRDIEELFHS